MNDPKVKISSETQRHIRTLSGIYDEAFSQKYLTATNHSYFLKNTLS